MINATNMRVAAALLATVATNATNAVIVDARPSGEEYDFCEIIVSCPKATSGGTSTITSLVIKNSDTTSTFATTLSTGGTDFTIVTSNDETNPAVQRLQVSMRGRKRYLQIVSQAAAGYAVLGVHALLGKGHQTPSQASSIVTI